jgi:hypothetical protein
MDINEEDEGGPAMAEQSKGVVDKAKNAASGAVDKAKGVTGTVVEKTKPLVDKAGDVAGTLLDKAKEKLATDKKDGGATSGAGDETDA